MQSKRRGIVLVNLGTPDAPTPVAVWRYLRALLDDPRVMPMSAILRWLLVNLVIAPFRARASARLYRAIWTAAGSPLLVHARGLAEEVQKRFPNDTVAIGMQVGSPSIADAMGMLGAVDELVIVPLYPQNAAATVGGATAAALLAWRDLGRSSDVRIVPPFFEDAGFGGAIARRIVEAGTFDHLVFSFHGLPVAQVPCVDAACEARTSDTSRDCYRSQCFATARAVGDALAARGAVPSWSVSFQSRLGRAEWLGPTTHDHLAELARAGIRCVAVACPAFVADCLETLHEIAVEEREAFIAAGGTQLVLVRGLNSGSDWADALASIIDTEPAYSPPPRKA